MKSIRIYGTDLRQRHQGFALIEVLVTVIVLAIGLLGIAGLQLTGLKYTHGAYQRAQIIIITDDIINRMQTNQTVARTGAYDIAIGDAIPTQSSCVAVNCTPAALAAADLYDWLTAVENILPSDDNTKANGAIERRPSANNTNIFKITVQWDDSRYGGTANKTITVETEI